MFMIVVLPDRSVAATNSHFREHRLHLDSIVDVFNAVIILSAFSRFFCAAPTPSAAWTAVTTAGSRCTAANVAIPPEGFNAPVLGQHATTPRCSVSSELPGTDLTAHVSTLAYRALLPFTTGSHLDLRASRSALLHTIVVI